MQLHRKTIARDARSKSCYPMIAVSLRADLLRPRWSLRSWQSWNNNVRKLTPQAVGSMREPTGTHRCTDAHATASVALPLCRHIEFEPMQAARHSSFSPYFHGLSHVPIYLCPLPYTVALDLRFGLFWRSSVFWCGFYLPACFLLVSRLNFPNFPASRQAALRRHRRACCRRKTSKHIDSLSNS